MSYQSSLAALPGYLASWQLDDAAGSATIADASGNGHTGTPSGLTLGVAGLVSDGGTAGSSGYVSAPASSAWNFGTGSFWMCGWFKTTQTGLGILMGWGSTDIWFGVSSGKASGLQGTGTTTLNDGNRHFFFLCRDASGNGSLYLDGSTTPEKTFTSTTAFNLASEALGLNALGTGSYACGATIDGLAVGNGVVSASQQAAVYTAGATANPTIVAPNSTAIAYSPYNWNVTSGAATTVNPGAYFSVLFTKTSITLSFDVAASFAGSQCWYRIDGSGGGEWQAWTYGPSLAVTGLALNQTHLFEFRFAGTTISQNRWNAGQRAGIVLTQIALDTGDVATAPARSTVNLIVFGDSTTEGYNSRPNSNGQPTQNDATACWSYLLRELLGCEVGVVGFGSQGWTINGQGNVPAFSSSWNLQYAGQSRNFSPAPDLAVIHHGINDGAYSVSAANVQSAMTTVISGLLAAGTKKVLCLTPYNGVEKAAVQAGAAANGASCVDATTVGITSTDYADVIHLTASAYRARFAPWVAAQVRSLGLLGSSAGVRSLSFGGGF